MTTPLAFSSCSRIIQLAYEDAGLVQEGESPSSDQWIKGLSRLNDLTNMLQTRGIKLFLNQTVTVPLVAGKGTYTLFPGGDVNITKPTQVLEAYYIDPTSVRRPLLSFAWHDYLMLSQQSQQGALNSYFTDKQIDRINLAFWQVPDTIAATGTVQLLVRAQVTNLATLQDTMNFPPEWFMALRWALADELATGQPDSIVARAAGKAKEYLAFLEGWDTEDAPTRFVLDPRAAYADSRFR